MGAARSLLAAPESVAKIMMCPSFGLAAPKQDSPLDICPSHMAPIIGRRRLSCCWTEVSGSSPLFGQSSMKTVLIQTGILVAFGFLADSTASAGSFNITGSSSTAQTLGSGSGQTGTITDTGSLTVSGTTNAVTISGNNATLTNLGTLEQTGTGRAIRDNTDVTGLTITNGSITNSTALIQAADGDVIQMNKSPPASS
jgi:hypothetical protein